VTTAAVTVVTAPEAKMAAALRRVTVVALADLDGPADGILELPVSVCWSLADRRFDLADPAQVRSAYKFVLDAARCAEHLIPYLNAALLKDAWPDLGMPRRKRIAWEAVNPELRSGPAVSAA
jgi:hypothetical protein